MRDFIINWPVPVHFYFKPNGLSFIFHFGLERLLPGQNIEIFWSALFFGVFEGAQGPGLLGLAQGPALNHYKRVARVHVFSHSRSPWTKHTELELSFNNLK